MVKGMLYQGGRRVGRVDDIDQAFIDQAAQVKAETGGGCYVIVGPGVPIHVIEALEREGIRIERGDGAQQALLVEDITPA